LNKKKEKLYHTMSVGYQGYAKLGVANKTARNDVPIKKPRRRIFPCGGADNRVNPGSVTKIRP
jgi:hypothetical protein